MAYETSGSRRNGAQHEDLGKHLRLDDTLDTNNKSVKVGDEVCPLEISTDSVQYRKAPSHHDDIVNKKYVDGTLSFRHIMNTGWYSTTALIYMPLNGYIVESTTLTGRNEYSAFVVPYDGTLERVIVRSEYASGDSIVGLHVSPTGTEIPNSSATATKTVDMRADDTPYAFDFGPSAIFTAGQILSISFDPTDQCGDTNATIVFRYNNPMVGV